MGKGHPEPLHFAQVHFIKAHVRRHLVVVPEHANWTRDLHKVHWRKRSYTISAFEACRGVLSVSVKACTNKGSNTQEYRIRSNTQQYVAICSNASPSANTLASHHSWDSRCSSCSLSVPMALDPMSSSTDLDPTTSEPRRHCHRHWRCQPLQPFRQRKPHSGSCKRHKGGSTYPYHVR